MITFLAATFLEVLIQSPVFHLQVLEGGGLSSLARSGWQPDTFSASDIPDSLVNDDATSPGPKRGAAAAARAPPDDEPPHPKVHHDLVPSPLSFTGHVTCLT